MWIVITMIILLFIIMFIYVCYRLAAFVVHPAYISLEKNEKIEKERKFWRDYNEIGKEEYSVFSYDGYELHVAYIPSIRPSKKFVVISHGYTSNRYGSLKYMHMFRKFGFHCLIYDDRGHGANIPVDCTMGVRESKDLIAVINDTYTRFGHDIWLGLHGESMGSGLQIMSLAYHPKVHFIVNDCGYADLMHVLEENLVKMFHLPKWLAYPASVMCKFLYDYEFTEVRPIDELKDNQVPICFIHGSDDGFIDMSHSVRMHEADAGYSELHLFPGADHAQSMFTDEKRYYSIVENFLRKVEDAENGNKSKLE